MTCYERHRGEESKIRCRIDIYNASDRHIGSSLSRYLAHRLYQLIDLTRSLLIFSNAAFFFSSFSLLYDVSLRKAPSEKPSENVLDTRIPG